MRSEPSGWFSAPPDGARLSKLDVRRAWLSRPDIAYRLPTRCIALFPGPEQYPFWVYRVSSTHEGPARLIALRYDDSDDEGQPVTLGPVMRDALLRHWPQFWSARDPGYGPTVLVRYDGLFRQTHSGDWQSGA